MKDIYEVASGVDAFYASSRNPVPAYHIEALTAQKNFSIENHIPGIATFGGERFDVLPYNWQKYPIALEHPNGRIGFTSSLNIPAIRLQIRSEFLHSVGAQEALNWFSEKLKALDVYPAWTLSRVDLYVDIQGWEIDLYQKDNFICRAKDISSHEVDGHFSGFNFGKRKSKTITCRIYNKTLELRGSNKHWTSLAWNEKYDSSRDVYRIEFEINRQALKQFGLDTSQEVLDSVSGLWSHATQEWLTHRNSSGDSNKSRWPISDAWKVIQESTIAGSRIPIERIRESKDAASLKSLIPALRGYLTSIALPLGSSDLQTTMKSVRELYLKDEAKNGITFESIIAEKRLRRS